MPSKVYFNPTTAIPQSFLFPTDVIKFMIKNSNGLVWFKLLQSCKYFYAKHKKLVFNNVFFDKNGSIEVADGDVGKCWNAANEIPYEIYLAERLHLYCSLETLMPKIYKCELRYLNISGIELFIEDFMFLVESDLLETFVIRDSNVFYSDKSVVQLEDIFVALSNVTNFSYHYTKRYLSDKSRSPKTFHRMAESSRNRKLKYIYLEGINDLNIYDFVSFVRKQADSNCQITLKVVSATTPDLFNCVNLMIFDWKPQSAKPYVLHKGPDPDPFQMPVPIQMPTNRRLVQSYAQINEILLNWV